jgi:hypothetical protein
MTVKKTLKKNFVFMIPFLFITSSFSFTIVDHKMEYKTHNNTSEPCNGYTVMSKSEGNAFLIDMDGNVIHTWSLIGFPPKMLTEGDLLGGYNQFTMDEDTCVAQEDWNGTIVWEFYNWDNGSARQHHDLEREGNPVGYYAPGQDFVDKGKTLVLAHSTVKNTSISKWPLDDDVIYEVDWNGSLTGYEWHAADHFQEMGFDIWAKFGIYFQKLPYIMRTKIMGWLHVDSISELGENQWYDNGDNRFNPHNIIICSRHAGFIAVIERSSGKIIWRVGPDYSRKTIQGQKLGPIIGPHQAHIIPKGLPGAGNILVFDNGGFAGYGILGLPCRYIRFYSRVIEFNPLTYDIVWEYENKTGPIFQRNGNDSRFFSILMGSAQRLPNGNTLICDGNQEKVFEVTPEKNIVWEYTYPGGLGKYLIKDIYRAYRVPPEWVPGNPAGYTPWE